MFDIIKVEILYPNSPKLFNQLQLLLFVSVLTINHPKVFDIVVSVK